MAHKTHISAKQLVFGELQIADDLNNYCLSVADKLASSLPHVSISPISFCSRGFIRTPSF